MPETTEKIDQAVKVMTQKEGKYLLNHYEEQSLSEKPTYEEMEHRIRELEKEILAHKQTADALKEAYDIINKSPAIVFLWKNEEGWPVEFVSDNVREIFGYTKEEFVSGRVSYAKIVHPDDLERVGDEVANNSSNSAINEFSHAPYRIIAKEGESRWLDDRTFIRRDKNGEITHYQGIVLDITYRKQAENALQESEVRFREIFNNSNNGIVIYDAVNAGEDFHIVDCNPACERIEDIKRDNLIGKSILQVFPRVKDFGLFDVLKRVWKTGKPVKHPVGMYKDERISGWRANFVCRLPTGEIVAIYSDETDRMRVEQALQESYKRMETALFSLPTGVMIIDTETHEIIEANPQAILMIGSPLEQIIGSKYHQFICPAEEERSLITDLGIPSNSSEGKLITVAGEMVPIHQTVIPVIIDDRGCSIVNFFDIREHKQAESERIQKEKLQGVVEMAGAVCHEMNQPLQVVAGLSELLAMDIKEGSPLFNNLMKIKEQANRMGEITKKLAKVTKYETKGYLKGKIIDIDKATL